MEEDNNKTNETVPAADDFIRKFTLDGEVLVENLKGGYKEYPLREVDLLPNAALKEAHIIELKQFHSLLRIIKKRHPKRTVPVTRRELLRFGADEKLLNALIKMGYLKEEIIPLVTSDGRNTGSQVCFYYTLQGRALIRAKLDPDYCKTGYR